MMNSLNDQNFIKLRLEDDIPDKKLREGLKIDIEKANDVDDEGGCNSAIQITT